MVESFGLLRQKDIVAKMVGYIMGNTEYVTDFSEGSIIRSLCEAVAEELYSSNVAFAQGVIGAINSSVKQAFNFPSLQASNATGVYTFYRKMLASPISISTSTANSQKGISLVSGGVLPYSNATWSRPTYFGITGVTSSGKVPSGSSIFIHTASPQIYSYGVSYSSSLPNYFTKRTAVAYGTIVIPPRYGAIIPACYLENYYNVGKVIGSSASVFDVLFGNENENIPLKNIAYTRDKGLKYMALLRAACMK